MSTFEGFRAVAHLLEQLGDERFAALISSANTGKVKEFCDTLVVGGFSTAMLPTEMTIEGRTYDILSFPSSPQKLVVSRDLAAIAKDKYAHLGQDDGEHILKYQDQIPAILRGRVIFIFTNWSFLKDPALFHFVYWFQERWCASGPLLGLDDLEVYRLLRRHT